jgi:hypothetical protein
VKSQILPSLSAREDFIEFCHRENFMTYPMFDAEMVHIRAGKI